MSNDASRQAELAIVIPDQANRGKGFGREALTLLVDFGTANLHKIHLRVFSENTGAIALYRSLGFVDDGILRDEVYRGGRYHDQILMSILKKEWRGRSVADRPTDR